MRLHFQNSQDIRYDDRLYYNYSVMYDKITEARKARMARLQGMEHLPRTLNAMQVLEAVRSDDSELQSLVDVLPTDLRSATLERQVQVALACFSWGIGVSKCFLGGFDTHGNSWIPLIFLVYNRLLKR